MTSPNSTDISRVKGEDPKRSVQEIVEKLYHYTLDGNWKEVVEIYEKHAEVHNKGITSSKNTALHVAVNDGQDDFVQKLVEIIVKREQRETFEIRNEQGDTPLHCAASRGSLKMCKCIVEVNDKLIEARNENGETPLYLAALHGHKDAFLYLHSHCNDKSLGPCRRTNDGDTILHCTISRDYFDLAFQIIHLYERQGIVSCVDERGISPLHILAGKPSAFESSSNFRWYNKLAYRCIIVEPLKVGNADTSVKYTEQLPKNYDTCFNFVKFLSTIVCTKKEADTENPSYDRNRYVPPNYKTCYDLFISAFPNFIGLALAVFGLLPDLKKKKQKHVWSGQILDALWKWHSEAYIGGGSGSKPQVLLIDESGEEIQKILKHDPRRKQNPHKANENGIQNVDDKQNQQKGETDKNGTQNVGDKQNQQKVVFQNPQEFCQFLSRLCNGDANGSPGDSLCGDQCVIFGCCVCRCGEREKIVGDKRETALLFAAKYGVLEIVEKILQDKPGAIHETNSQNQNVLHVAVEYRQPHVFESLRGNRLWDNLIRDVDKDGNTVLHLAAKLSKYKPWHIPGSAMQMQWEIKWFLYIKGLMPPYMLFQKNKQKETPREIFARDHENLVKEGSEWLKSTSESCSVVAALIAGVAFATSSSIPGGTQDETGRPYLEGHPAFNIFALTSLLALCCSTTSLIMFLAILTSRQQPLDFRRDLPFKLLLGLSSLFVSIASILVSFSAAFFFVLKDKLKQVVFPLYAATCLPITFYAVAQFPLYFDLLRAIFRKTPQSSNRESEKLIL